MQLYVTPYIRTTALGVRDCFGKLRARKHTRTNLEYEARQSRHNLEGESVYVLGRDGFLFARVHSGIDCSL